MLHLDRHGAPKNGAAAKVQNGHATVARFLIDVGARVDCADAMGQTPLSCAVSWDFVGDGKGTGVGKCPILGILDITL